ncbi:metallopeptidase TldD-related protein [Caenimonas sp. SL110]|uniref:metallopeptidase TldD-related protein n=1 Tax=Caenimonas sp. SL110 TaxID=1450524 RepID=UPI000653E262|nr:metallopeptidase TldD-related protein [Caenimonas sp. SL110]
MEATLKNAAQTALELMRSAGFEHAQVTAAHTQLDELNVAHNEPSLLRSAESHKLSLMGIVEGRVASTEMADLSADAMRERIAGLYADAKSAPQDDANAVSSNQRARIVQGPQEADRDLMAGKMAELLAFRATETPKMMIDEGDAKHTLRRWHTLTTGGSDLSGSVGCYSLGAFGTARDGNQSSSFNYTGGDTNDLGSAPAQDQFGMGQMLRDTERQIHTQPAGGKFVGDVVLTPNAVASLLSWLQGQLSDTQLISGSSLYRDSVGQIIASPLLTVRSRFDSPGVAAMSGDGFVTPAVTLVDKGRLLALTPTLYGSRKTGLKHVPVAGGGWVVESGATPLAEMVGGVKRGALVGRLSMGSPAANGNFSGVIKNSFLIEGGELGTALSEVMIAGNMAQMLKDIVAVSQEVIDSGSLSLPWLRINNLHFS